MELIQPRMLIHRYNLESTFGLYFLYKHTNTESQPFYKGYSTKYHEKILHVSNVFINLCSVSKRLWLKH